MKYLLRCFTICSSVLDDNIDNPEMLFGIEMIRLIT